ncbi:hypothetical protein D9758_014678 [Tetrapyrgos nigripes]|uniref:DNA 3'-5' helicase n=1 Tax=Tetrapyrgos nigripes TaxID=182062 RepID=A0A8H5CKZ8_9AGAR|nr:hypothetical protein D9758_014678 [Tetrapyrgos nigripes]
MSQLLSFPFHTPGTPRRWKYLSQPSYHLQGIKTHLPTCIARHDAIRHTLKEDLALKFELDDWQCHVVHRVLQGYDSICIAATGLGKSLMFEGTVKLTLVICPLKMLEHNHVLHAEAKGLNTVIVNEDMDKTPELWEKICTSAQIVYCSPEMALSDSFNKLSLWTRPML